MSAQTILLLFFFLHTNVVPKDLSTCLASFRTFWLFAIKPKVYETKCILRIRRVVGKLIETSHLSKSDINIKLFQSCCNSIKFRATNLSQKN